MTMPTRHLLLSTLLLGMLAFAPGFAGDAPSANLLGQKCNRNALMDLLGKDSRCDEVKDTKATVVVFLSFDCPVCTSYLPTLVELTTKYGDRVAFIGVCSCKVDDDLARRIKEYKLNFPVLHDEGSAAAGALGARVTPEAVILDSDCVLRYRGRIDDGYVARLKKNANVTRHDLRDALEQVLAGKEVSTPATEAVGCPIACEKPAKATGRVSYYRDVAPILQENCQSCHRPGEVGPFSLMTYEQAVTWSSDIKDYTQSHKMPPWKPSDGLPIHGERKMAEKDIATLAAWVDGGTPEGDPKDAPPARKFTEGWQLGKPDLILTPSAEYQVGPGGEDVFRCFVLPTNLAEDQDVVAVEYRPGNPRVVHHALLFIDSCGKGREKEEIEKKRTLADTVLDRGPGYSTGMGGIGFVPYGGMGGWAPGQLGRFLPEGTGYRLPKSSDVIMQIHYHRDGKLEKDKSQVGLYFAKKPVARLLKNIILPGFFDAIPAGHDDYKVLGAIIVNQDCVLRSLMPHMHMVGKEIKVTITPPEGEKKTLIAIKDWDYNWQETYFLKEALPIEKGTRLDVEAIYDNSERNPINPNRPPKDVEWGEQTTDEMCFVFLGATDDEQAPKIKAEVVNKLALLKFQIKRQQKAKEFEEKRESKEGKDSAN
jgi:peroxiredoxin